MGYAQISGIPAVYGLYGSVLPILLFALFSTSRQFIFGVDAAPAAIVGGALSTLGIAAESEAAMDYVPAIALFAGLWLFVWSKPLQQGGFSVHHLLSRVQNVGKIEIAIGNLVRFCDAVIKEYHK